MHIKARLLHYVHFKIDFVWYLPFIKLLHTHFF